MPDKPQAQKADAPQAEETKAAVPPPAAEAPPETAAETPPLERQTSQDFEVGSTEEPYLGAGVTADAAFAAKQETVDQLAAEQGAALNTQANPEVGGSAYVGPTTEDQEAAQAQQKAALEQQPQSQ